MHVSATKFPSLEYINLFLRFVMHFQCFCTSNDGSLVAESPVECVIYKSLVLEYQICLSISYFALNVQDLRILFSSLVNNPRSSLSGSHTSLFVTREHSAVQLRHLRYKFQPWSSFLYFKNPC